MLMVTVVAQYQVKAGEGDRVADALAPHIAATRAEPGCVTFVAYRADDDPDHFLLYEQYVDEAAFQEHRRTPHFAEYVEGTIVPLLERRDWQRYDEVPPALG
jgi:quinol monooxygenase YgiN